MARKAKPFRLHCGKIPYETLTSPGLTSRARFTSMKPINRLLAQSNTPKARLGPPLRQLSWLFRMNASTVESVLRPPLSHLAISSSSPARWSAASSGVSGRRIMIPSVNRGVFGAFILSRSSHSHPLKGQHRLLFGSTETARLIYTSALIDLSSLKSVAGIVIPRSLRSG